jgi:hypothetical protein
MRTDDPHRGSTGKYFWLRTATERASSHASILDGERAEIQAKHSLADAARRLLGLAGEKVEGLSRMLFRRAPVLHLTICGALALSGCLLAVDPNDLAAGNNLGDTSGGLNARCLDFSAYRAGTSAPNWIEGSGTWRIVEVSQQHALGQTAASTSSSARFVAWYDAIDWSDASVSAVVRLTNDASANCVTLRVQDKSTFYALCLMRTGSGTYWKLERDTASSATWLAAGDIDNGDAPHTLALRARGTRLTSMIDGATRSTVEDSQLAHGALGVSTDGLGAFTAICMAQL